MRSRAALCFFDPSLRIHATLWHPFVVSAGLQSENHFRTINVQWIEQWGLFSRCGISQNQCLRVVNTVISSTPAASFNQLHCQSTAIFRTWVPSAGHIAPKPSSLPKYGMAPTVNRNRPARRSSSTDFLMARRKVGSSLYFVDARSIERAH